MKVKNILFFVLALSLLVSCNFPSTGAQLNSPAGVGGSDSSKTDKTVEEVTATMTETATSIPTSTSTSLPTLTPTITLTPTLQVVGPDEFPAGINPLSGQIEEEPENLELSPALVSITNFPPSARPQAGLSFSPFVFEMFIGEGMTRFLALFYGKYPGRFPSTNASLYNDLQIEEEEPSSEAGSQATAAAPSSPSSQNTSLATDTIGPIRSGRLPYESIRKQFNGFLVMSSGSANIVKNLSEYSNIYGADEDDINSAMIPVNKLEDIARANKITLTAKSLTGNVFNPNPPQGGLAAKSFFVYWSNLNQVFWRYNPKTGAYHRWQDNADGKTFIEFSDRLNGEKLTYENVIILFATHHEYAETVIDLDLMYIPKMPAVLLRDGQLFKIYWTTRNEDFEKKTGLLRPLRYVDADGNPVPLKPGQTWVVIMPDYTNYWETAETENWVQMMNTQQPGSGFWAARFYEPEIEPWNQ